MIWSSFPTFGSALILCVMLVASYTFTVSLVAGSNGRPRSLQAARFGAYGTVVLIAAAVFALAYAFVTHDFRMRYVAHYSDRSMPVGYLLTALWGGQDGSLLWWLFLLSIYIGLCVFWLGNKYVQLQPYVIATLMAVVLFFCVLTAFPANPFATSIGGARTDGEGLNPLLQNFYMIIHPPSLYVGFVGCSVPFAFAVAALITGRLDQEWIVASRKWMLFAWMFLAIGNTLGMLWAYEELGWGGYWGWDPVENAAFMPFLSATAYLHSVMIQERRGLLKVWNVVLICATFFMTIFGTFLTRSGAIASVHAFAQSSIGTYFVWFLVALVIFAATLIFYRWPELRDLPPTRQLRIAAVVTGWTIIGGCVVALWMGNVLPFDKWFGGMSDQAREAADAAGVMAPQQGLSRAKVIKIIFVTFLVGGAVFAGLELVFRRLTRGMKLVSRRPRIESILSREFTFLINNWGLVGFMFFVLVATTFPMITEALSNEKVSVGPQFYEQLIAHPLGLAIFFLMGIGTLFGWKKTSPEALRRAFVAPTAGMVVVAVVHLLAGKALGFPAVVWKEALYPGALGSALRALNAVTPLLGMMCVAFNAIVIVQEFVMLFRSRTKSGANKGTPAILWWLGGVPGFVYTMITLSPQSRRRYGGYIVHFGIVFMLFGFTGKSWNVDKEASLRPGESMIVDRYSLEYVGPRTEVDTSKQMRFADVNVSDAKTGKLLGKATPAKFVYKRMPDQPTTEVSILNFVRDDVYVVVGNINPETKVATFQSHVNPLVSWIWIGCLLLMAGSVLCMWPQFEPNESRAWSFARAGAGVAASIAVGIFLASIPGVAHAQSSLHAAPVKIDNAQEKALFEGLRCMCGTCARDLLSTCGCDFAKDTREELRAKMDSGMSRDAIVEEYARKWGTSSLAVPPNTGYMRAIYVVPAVGIVVGGAGVFFMLRRWRKNDDDDDDRRGPPAPPADPGTGKTPTKRDDYDARLDEELKDLD